MGTMRTANTETDELLEAEIAVEQSPAELNRSLRRVSQSSEQLLNRVRAELKPGLVIAGVVVGAAALTGVAVAVARSRARKHRWLAPEQPSTLGVLAKTVGLWGLRLAARGAARALVARLEEGEPRAAVPPRHDVPAAAQ